MATAREDRFVENEKLFRTANEGTSPERPTRRLKGRHTSIREKPPLPGAFRFRSGDAYGRNWLRKFLE
jgi:hypothetical protein